MRKIAAFLAGILALAALSVSAQTQNIQTKLKNPVSIPPTISSAFAEYQYPSAINLVVTGVRFPSTQGHHLVRLVAFGGSSDGSKGDVYFVNGNKTWSSIRIESFLSTGIVPGRRFKIGIVEYTTENVAEKKLISNEVEISILFKLESASPNPVPLGQSEVEIETPNSLGTKGAKVVKYGNQAAQVTSWGTSKFKFIIPPNVMRPGAFDVFIENDGQIVSTKHTVRTLGPIIK